jgi:hypothetical protein
MPTTFIGLGVMATTNAGGAHKWRSEYSESLRGADVVLLPDNDKAGRDHAAAVATALTGIANRIRILDIAAHWPECPAKGDISDWLAAGGTTERLAAMVEVLPDWRTNSQNSELAASPWPVMEREAFHGLAGKVVETIAPHSEADPNGLLLQFLAAFGNAIGACAHYLVEGDQHRAKLFLVTSGATSKGRKGTAMGRVRQLMALADSEWATANIQSGLSSGEGVIYAVRDAVEKVGATRSSCHIREVPIFGGIGADYWETNTLSAFQILLTLTNGRRGGAALEQDVDRLPRRPDRALDGEGHIPGNLDVLAD